MRSTYPRIALKPLFFLGTVCFIIAVLMFFFQFYGGGGGGSNSNNGELPMPTMPLNESQIGEKQTVAVFYIGKDGVSQDQKTWYLPEQFDEMIAKCQKEGIEQINHERLPTSIPKIEMQWQESLRKANMKNARIDN